MDSEQLSLNIQLEANLPPEKTVECLGMTFASDEERRDYFTEKLREKLQDSEFRQIEGFPIGEDEDILALSDPPYYTACPNPFIEDFINYWNIEKDNNSSADIDEYHREPFAADVSEGKNDPIYNAHSYHTKVPHKAIMRYILHYTEPGNIVFDGFCGTGMTGVAAQLCGDKAAVESLGYKVQADGTILDEQGKAFSKLGARRAILNDLSPAATFISYNYNNPVDVDIFTSAAKKILDDFDICYGWMYKTRHPNSNYYGRINYVIWSDVFYCNYCQGEIVFWNEAVENGLVKDNILCPHCSATINKKALERATTTQLDPVRVQTVVKAKRIPAIINYSIGKDRFEKKPDEEDNKVLQKIEDIPILEWYPTCRIDKDIDLWYERDYRSLGIYSIDAFFTKRNLIMISFFHQKISKKEGRLKGFLWFWLQSVLMGFSLLNRYRYKGYSQVNQILSGTLYVGALIAEISPWYALEGKINRLKIFKLIKNKNSLISTGSTSITKLVKNSLDYIFTDPPFGSNIIYSDLNMIWESWLKISTNTSQEAVVHRRKKIQAFTLEKYTEIMKVCFEKMHFALKPGRWITIEFHNSKNSVWTAIQEALQQAGFVVADVRTLDKKQGSFKQVNSNNAVKQDLIISAYKPTTNLEQYFKLEVGTEESCWEFIRNHLQKLPRFVPKDGKSEIIAERQNYLLFDRMVAFYIKRDVTVPLSASEFYAGLAQRFTERDEMYFLQDQVAEYDKKRMTVKEILQLELVVINEETAVQWLKQKLTKKPQTFQEIHPQFMLSKAAWSKAEKSLELLELLEQNFLRYEGKGTIPQQIVSWLKLSSIHHHKIYKIEENLPSDAIGLETNDPILISATKDKWYVPDPNQTIDLEKLREKSLLREFEEYRQSKQKKLKIFRLEAIRAGFAKAWKDKLPQIIVDVANKIPENVLQEDPKLIRFYDNALNRLEE